MAFLLGTHNVFNYLTEQAIGTGENFCTGQVQLISCKNFNVCVRWPDQPSLLVKQEPHNLEGRVKGDFHYEWNLYALLRYFPELNTIRQLVSEAIHFDSKHSILIFNYLEQYQDLEEFYSQQHSFPVSIAYTVGSALATVHRLTMQRQVYKDFLAKNCPAIDKRPRFLQDLNEIKPEIFGELDADGLKFLELFQRYSSLSEAIAELNCSHQACCLTHSDLKLDNILLHQNWQHGTDTNSQEAVIRFIDWEKWRWGDPARDIGMVIASYLKFWLGSLIISTEITVETALQLAGTPLETLQPSITALMRTYLERFPDILTQRSDFLNRVIQYAGLALIERLQSKIHYLEPFGNPEICMLQVAKTLLCDPETSIPIVFGMTAAELNDSTHAMAVSA